MDLQNVWFYLKDEQQHFLPRPKSSLRLNQANNALQWSGPDNTKAKIITCLKSLEVGPIMVMYFWKKKNTAQN